MVVEAKLARDVLPVISAFAEATDDNDVLMWGEADGVPTRAGRLTEETAQQLLESLATALATIATRRGRRAA